jgi:hypothetical protein
LKKEKESLHGECDMYVHGWTDRKQGNEEEIAAMKEAAEVLEGI